MLTSETHLDHLTWVCQSFSFHNRVWYASEIQRIHKYSLFLKSSSLWCTAGSVYLSMQVHLTNSLTLPRQLLNQTTVSNAVNTQWAHCAKTEYKILSINNWLYSVTAILPRWVSECLRSNKEWGNSHFVGFLINRNMICRSWSRRTIMKEAMKY